MRVGRSSYFTFLAYISTAGFTDRPTRWPNDLVACTRVRTVNGQANFKPTTNISSSMTKSYTINFIQSSPQSSCLLPLPDWRSPSNLYWWRRSKMRGNPRCIVELLHRSWSKVSQHLPTQASTVTHSYTFARKHEPAYTHSCAPKLSPNSKINTLSPFHYWFHYWIHFWLILRSSVSVMPVTMHFQLRPDSPVMTPALDTVPEEAAVASSHPGKGMLDNFVKSVKSRLIVMQVGYLPGRVG